MVLKPGKLEKGKLGEAIVDMYLMDRGVIPYKPVLEEAAHPFDRLCASRDKRRLFVVEVKAKPARYAYPDTGINISHWNDYTNIQDTYRIDVYIFFVDEERREVYGGEFRAGVEDVAELEETTFTGAFYKTGGGLLKHNRLIEHDYCISREMIDDD